MVARPPRRPAHDRDALARGRRRVIGVHPREHRVEHRVLGFVDGPVRGVDREDRVLLGRSAFRRALPTSWAVFLLSMSSRTASMRSFHDFCASTHQSEIRPSLSAAFWRTLSLCA